MSSGVFGDDIDSSVLYEVDCLGDETEVLSCSYSSLGDHSEHSASVLCQGMQFLYNTIVDIILCDF